MSLIISRTPLRVSLLGGGSDFPQWIAKHDGAILSAAIDKYIYVTARFMPEFYPNGYKVIWKHIEQVPSIAEILHPTVRAALKTMGFEGRRGVEITYHGDLPANTGMGTSSAFAVGLLNALSILRGDAPWSASELAASAMHLEQDVMGEAVGCQDQIAAAFGGVNYVNFPAGSQEWALEALSGPQVDNLERRLMLFYTGQTRLGAALAGRLVAAMPAKVDALRRTAALATVGRAALAGRSQKGTDFGALMDKAWAIKRSLAEGITTPRVDEWYRRARAAGATGGKLLGAGGAGFMVFHVPEDWQDGVKDALSDLIHVPFRFEREGSKIIMNGDNK